MLFFCVLSTIQNENQARQTRTEEDALLVRVGQGDRDALETLSRLTSRAVYGCLLSIVKNPHDAEELMQDTYLQLVSSAGSYRPQGKPRSFILAVARNLGLMRLREERRFPAAGEEETETLPAAGNEAGRAEDRLVLECAMRVLGDEERQVVMLHAVAGLKHRETAALMGLPLSTVLSRYHRALGKLQKALMEGETAR